MTGVDFGHRLELGSRLLRGASRLGAGRGCSRWPCVWAFLDRRSTPSLCVLAGAVGPHCTVFGSVVGWELAPLHRGAGHDEGEKEGSKGQGKGLELTGTLLLSGIMVLFTIW